MIAVLSVAAGLGLLVGSLLTKKLYFTRIQVKTVPVKLPCAVCEIKQLEDKTERNFAENPPSSVIDPVENPFEQEDLDVNPS